MGQVSAGGATRAQPRPRPPIAKVLWIVAGVLFLLGPLVATFFSSINYNQLGYRFTAYSNIVSNQALRRPLWLSFQIAVLTAALSFALMLPTVFWLHLKVPKARPIIETISILPYVIPPIVLVVGISQLTRGWPEWLIGKPFFLVPIYVITCLPFLFRALDAGMRSIDVMTLTEAARGLGATWRQVITKVIMPNLRTSILGGTFLALAVVLGEFTIASLLLFKTFPIYLTEVGQNEAQGAAALSLLSFGFSWGFLLLLNFVGKRVGSGASLDIAPRVGR